MIDDDERDRVKTMTLAHCPTHAVCPSCREGVGHWISDTERYQRTVESEAVRAQWPGGGMTVEEALAAMRQHTADNPTHGTNCACKDRYIGAARRAIGERDADAAYLLGVLTRH